MKIKKGARLMKKGLGILFKIVWIAGVMPIGTMLDVISFPVWLPVYIKQYKGSALKVAGRELVKEYSEFWKGI
jgi:hypothetical protein